LYDSFIDEGAEPEISLQAFEAELKAIRSLVVKEHQSLYLSEINSLLNKIHLFGYHFAILDIRQDSRVHESVFNTLAEGLIKSESDILPKNY
ncbi:phosphoenolpyruvate carboxylase, partial [Halomonas marinisediminis]